MQTTNTTEQASQGLVPQLLYNNTWKISSADGVADWSPTEDILVISSLGGFEPRVLLYAANGTRLMTIAEFKQGEFISSARFSPNGSKIAFTHAMPPDLSSQLEIFDLKTKATQNIQFQENFTDFDWMPDGDHILYATPNPESPDQFWNTYELRIHNIRTGTETVIQDSDTNVQYFDLSHDGTMIVLSRQVPVQEPCQTNIEQSCTIDEMAILTLEKGEENRNASSTDSQSQINDSNKIISSKVIKETSNPFFTAFPRWVLNDSAIIYSVFYYRCGGPMFAISPDGTSEQTLFSSSPDEGYSYDACYERGGVLNKDGTILAYVKNSGIQVAHTSFNPVNTGLYLTFTELCNNRQCTPPTNTIPFVAGRADAVTQPISQYGSPQYNVFLSAGYESLGLEVNEQTKTLSMTLQGPRAGDGIGERDVLLYLPSSLIDGHMTLLINGTQFYPSNDCLSKQTEEFCSKIKADIDKIEGWSIVNITDDATDDRSTVSVEIVGTTVTPEFGTPLTAVAVAMSLFGAILTYRLARLRMKGKLG